MQPLFAVLFLAVATGALFGAWKSLVRVPAGKVGLVDRRFALTHHPDDIYHVRLHGSAGKQAEVIRSGRLAMRTAGIFEISYSNQVRIPDGSIGLVIAKDGNARPPERLLGAPVECNRYRDGVAFLRGGGEMGRQLDTLPAGIYDINTEMFDVITVDNCENYDIEADSLRPIEVPEGMVGVVITREGTAPPADEPDESVGPILDGHSGFQDGSRFVGLGGWIGTQEQTLRAGSTQYINPWFARVHLVPTGELVLEWTKREKSPGAFDASLQPIRVNVEGHWIWIDITQTIRISAKGAPRLIGRFGERVGEGVDESYKSKNAAVQRFVTNVLGPIVESYFVTIASEYSVMEFSDYISDVRLDLEDRIRQELSLWDVEAVRTTLGVLEPEDETVYELLRERSALIEQLENEEQLLRVADISERIRQRRLETDRLEVMVPLAALEEEIRLLGEDNVGRERFMRELVKMNVPETLIGDASQFFSYFPAMVRAALGSMKDDQAALSGTDQPELERSQSNRHE